MVADMASIESPSRASRASTAKARPRSHAAERSWNSSKTTSETPVRKGSSCTMRMKTASVMNSTSVSRLALVSPRTRYPTALPSSVPSSSETREAAETAAILLGSRTSAFPAHAFVSTRYAGTALVLPAPVSADRTSEPSVSARAMSGSNGKIGRSSRCIPHCAPCRALWTRQNAQR